MKKALSRTISLILPSMTVFLLSSCRDTVRYLVEKWGAPAKESPVVYHATEGYSPTKNKRSGLENHDRYHYYISPDPKEMNQMYQPSYNYDYTQDYEPFDEEKYWKENHLEFPEVNDDEYYHDLEINE